MLCHNFLSFYLKYKSYIIPPFSNKRLKRVKPYIEASSLGGGITVSGGEPLGQAEFVLELFKECKKQGFHTCLDTAGSYEINDTIKELLEYTDLVLLDIKHIDDEKCKKLVGVSNKRELEFAQYLSDNNIKIWIRQVVVPGYTDDEEDLKKLKEFIKSLKTVEHVAEIREKSVKEILG